MSFINLNAKLFTQDSSAIFLLVIEPKSSAIYLIFQWSEQQFASSSNFALIFLPSANNSACAFLLTFAFHEVHRLGIGYRKIFLDQKVLCITSRHFFNFRLTFTFTSAKMTFSFYILLFNSYFVFNSLNQCWRILSPQFEKLPNDLLRQAVPWYASCIDFASTLEMEQSHGHEQWQGCFHLRHGQHTISCFTNSYWIIGFSRIGTSYDDMWQNLLVKDQFVHFAGTHQTESLESPGWIYYHTSWTKGNSPHQRSDS